MIDYGDLRKKAEAEKNRSIEQWSLLSPDERLRLLDITQRAIDTLSYIADDATDIDEAAHVARIALDEIAKLEKV